jgi:hypothetical protein
MHGHHAHAANMQPYQFGMPDPSTGQGNIRYDDQAQHTFDMQGVGPSSRRGLTTTTATSSRSSSSSEVEKSVPRKRSFSANPPAQKTNPNGIATPTSLSTNLEENINMSMFNDIASQSPFGHAPRLSTINHQEIRRIQMDVNAPVSYDEMDIGGYTLLDPHSQSHGSPIDGNVSPIDGGSGNGDGDDDDPDADDVEGERDDQLKPLEGIGGGLDMHGGSGGSMGILGKPLGTNNFVTKLYQMISDSASSRFISWTELGTSFVVSNVGEFSRSILGSHFKHNNFSSFVRQLNMYGFHKINRTPRSQRTSTDAQTWEFSHHKFLRGRPDLLDEIKRKALEPDPAVKHRVELPGEMMLMREENRRVWEALMNEKRKVEKLTGAVKTLWDVVGKGFPGIPPFPSDLLDGTESPNIYITSPTSSAPRSYLPPLSTATSLSSQSLHSISSPNSSPTTTEFPNHMHPPSGPPLSRQHSFQQMAYPNSRGETALSTPLPSSPGSTSMDLFEGSEAGDGGRGSSKRQRTSNTNSDVNLLPNGVVGVKVGVEEASAGGAAVAGGPNGKRLSRARSDSAPLGYGLGAGLNGGWQQGGTRPRSGSGLAGRGLGVGMPGVAGANRANGGAGGNGNGGGTGNGPPLLSMPTMTNNSPGR